MNLLAFLGKFRTHFNALNVLCHNWCRVLNPERFYSVLLQFFQTLQYDTAFFSFKLMYVGE